MYLNQIKSTPWILECDITVRYRVMTVQIGFSHDEEPEDETEFCIEAWNMEELAALFDEFCKENQFRNVKVNGICIVRVADSMEELAWMEENLR